ncbi:hypothetical protein F441_06014 [Phytophthora nicotianae CJ01A1]|uniref:HTH myb-type domain-containing protein n=1 Tax=Phytophthora nicotianae CJ01A1 TaxID=1317063 RepID=W2XCN6_PHYNI|nr:hypothetical protein F441_06014 [Phytophthora nicotianae CJ01A1]
MSHPSSSNSSTWTRGSDVNWTLTHQRDTLQPPRKILLSTLRVKVVTTEPGSSTPAYATDSVHKSRIQNWFKASFKWCVNALTLCCLRQPKRSSYTEICRGPTLGSKPTISTNARGDSSSIEFVPIRSPLCGPVQKPAPLPHDDDEDDDLSMKSARIAAREIERCGAKLSPAKPREMMKKSGIWGCDEHERYCEALEMYRYGSWKQIAAHVGSRTERQVLSHAQSIRARKRKDEERQASAISSRLSLLEARKSTPEELLAASMKGPLSVNLPSFVNHRSDVVDASVDTAFTDLPPWDLSFDLDLSLTEEFEAKVPVERTNGEMTYDDEGSELQRSTKRSKLDPAAIVSFDAPLSSSSLEIFLEGVLSDDDVLELLEIPPTPLEIEHAS